MKYKKYFRKTSLKQKNIGDLFLKEIQKSNPKSFLEIGIFHGVTARNVCELMSKNHGSDFSYIGIDIFDEGEEYKDEVVPVKTFNNPLKNFYFKYIKRQNKQKSTTYNVEYNIWNSVVALGSDLIRDQMFILSGGLNG